MDGIGDRQGVERKVGDLIHGSDHVSAEDEERAGRRGQGERGPIVVLGRAGRVQEDRTEGSSGTQIGEADGFRSGGGGGGFTGRIVGVRIELVDAIAVAQIAPGAQLVQGKGIDELGGIEIVEIAEDKPLDENATRW